MSDEEERCIVIEHDNMTGWEKLLDNYATKPWSDTFSLEQAEAMVEWRRKHITNRYSYEVRPVVVWVLDIATGNHHNLFMRALETDFREQDPYGTPTVWTKGEGVPGGLVYGYTRKGTNSPPEWLVGLCGYFENEGFEAGIRRP